LPEWEAYTIGMMILAKDKYKAAFLYMLQVLEKIEGKKKACKLFYFLDFDYYEAYETSFTGETYISYPIGPFPQYFEPIVKEMEEEGIIQIDYEKKSPTHENVTVIYRSVEAPNYPFTKKECSMLDRIVKKYGSLTGKDLQDLSHAQAPYNAVYLNEVIPYEFSFYRDTPDLTEDL
jgi:uncharacterized phage-associated protein